MDIYIKDTHELFKIETKINKIVIHSIFIKIILSIINNNIFVWI